MNQTDYSDEAYASNLRELLDQETRSRIDAIQSEEQADHGCLSRDSGRIAAPNSRSSGPAGENQAIRTSSQNQSEADSGL
ncbi:MAG: hypothetical protein KDK39_07565 [Leptospiraceae bacterium]|nr:hypothetical protein [Leptospiraceae bacterium]